MNILGETSHGTLIVEVTDEEIINDIFIVKDEYSLINARKLGINSLKDNVIGKYLSDKNLSERNKYLIRRIFFNYSRGLTIRKFEDMVRTGDLKIFRNVGDKTIEQLRKALFEQQVEP